MSNRTLIVGWLFLLGCGGDTFTAAGPPESLLAAGQGNEPDTPKAGGAGQKDSPPVAGAGQAGAGQAGEGGAGALGGASGGSLGGEGGQPTAGVSGSSPALSGNGGAGQAGENFGGAGQAGGGASGAGQAGQPEGGAGQGGAGEGGAGQAGAGAGEGGAGQAGQAGAGSMGGNGVGGGGQAGGATCELGKRRCDGLQPQVCNGPEWTSDAGECTYGCTVVGCVCEPPAGRFVEVALPYKFSGPVGPVTNVAAVKDTQTGVTWLNETTDQLTWAVAYEICTSNGGRLPSKAEVRQVQTEQYPAVSCPYNLPEPFKVLGKKIWTADGEPTITGTRYVIDLLSAKETLAAEGNLAFFRCVHDPF